METVIASSQNLKKEIDLGRSLDFDQGAIATNVHAPKQSKHVAPQSRSK